MASDVADAAAPMRSVSTTPRSCVEDEHPWTHETRIQRQHRRRSASGQRTSDEPNRIGVIGFDR